MKLQPCASIAQPHPFAAKCYSVTLSALPIFVMFVAFKGICNAFLRNILSLQDHNLLPPVT